MKKILKLVIGIYFGFWILSLGFPAFADAGGSSGVEFLKLGGGARPLAMGDAYVGLADDSSAMFYNPAGLAQLNFPEVLTMYNRWFVDTSQQMAGFALPANFGVLGVGYRALSSGDIQGYGAMGEITSIFNTGSSSLSLSFGRRINPNLSLGFGVKSVFEKLENSQASTYALDAGLLYRFNSQFAMGLSALNLGSGLRFLSENTPLPTTYRLGAAFSGKLFEDDISAAADLVSFADGTRVNLGVEYLVRHLLSLRVGSSAGSLRGGVGILAGLFSFDYAYLGHGDLGSAHQVSIGLLFGAEEKAKKLILENLTLGKAYLNENKFLEAILKFEKVIALDPKNEEAQIYLKKAQLNYEKEIFERVFAEMKVEVKRTVVDILQSGKSFMSQGKYLEALAEFSRVLEIEPTNREALKLQNEAQYKMESALIEKSKEEARGYLGEAMKFVIIGKYKEALEQVNLALEKDPRNQQTQDLKKKLEMILKIEKK